MREKGHTFKRIRTPADLTPNSVPVIGGLVLFDFGIYDHIGEVIDFVPAGLLIHHRYLSKGKCITTTDFIAWEKIRGIYEE